MVLTFENGNYIKIYKVHLENKTTIKVKVFSDIYPMKHIGKTTDTFGRLKFQLPQNLPFKAKPYAAGREDNIKLLLLVSNECVTKQSDQNLDLRNDQWDLAKNYWVHFSKLRLTQYI